MRKSSLCLPVSAMIVKHGKNFTTAKIFKQVCKTLFVTVIILYWNGQLVWTPALALYLCVGDRGLCPAGFIAHLRLYRHIRQAAIREFFLFAVGSHAVIIYFGWLGLALYNIVVRIMVRVDVRVRVTQG